MPENVKEKKISRKEKLVKIPCKICGKSISTGKMNLHLKGHEDREQRNSNVSNSNSIVTNHITEKESIPKSNKEEVRMANTVSPEVIEAVKQVMKEEKEKKQSGIIQEQLNENMQKVVNSLQSLTETLNPTVFKPSKPELIKEDIDKKQFLEQQKSMCEAFPHLCQQVASIESLLKKMSEKPVVKTHSTIEDIKSCPSCAAKLQEYVDSKIKEEKDKIIQGGNIPQENIKVVDEVINKEVEINEKEKAISTTRRRSLI